MNYYEYIQSNEWMYTAERIKIQRRCQECSSEKRLEVHHLTYKNLGNEQPDDLLVLCHRCHSKKRPKKVKRIRFIDPRSSKMRRIAKLKALMDLLKEALIADGLDPTDFGFEGDLL